MFEFPFEGIAAVALVGLVCVPISILIGYFSARHYSKEEDEPKTEKTTGE